MLQKIWLLSSPFSSSWKKNKEGIDGYPIDRLKKCISDCLLFYDKKPDEDILKCFERCRNKLIEDTLYNWDIMEDRFFYTLDEITNKRISFLLAYS